MSDSPNTEKLKTMARFLAAAAAFVLGASAIQAADLAKVNRAIAQEPHYESKAPKYCLLVFGPAATERVWLVLDGENLFVDRNGNGYLTEKGERFRVTNPGRDPAEFGPTDVTLNGKQHKFRLAVFGWSNFRKGNLKALRPCVIVSLNDGQSFVARGDEDSPLTFADSPRTAPIVHIGGPLQMAVEGPRPLKKVGAGKFELNATVGTKGLGTGAFARLSYAAIPKDTYPQATLEFPNADLKQPAFTVRMQLTKRC